MKRAAKPPTWEACQAKASTWLGLHLSGFDPFDTGCSSFGEATKSNAFPKEKIWAECAMVALLAQIAGVGGAPLNEAAHALAAPVKDPRFLMRLTRERAGFGAIIHTVALANRMGLDAGFEAEIVNRLIDADAIWSKDQEAWERLERQFSRAILGARVDHQDILDLARQTAVWDPDFNIAYVSEKDGYKLTHAIFYIFGLGLADVYDNAHNAASLIPDHWQETLNLLAAKFFLLGSLDLALELVLCSILIDAPLEPISIQILYSACVLTHALGFVAPFIFNGVERSSFDPLTATSQDAFRFGYHPTLVFLLTHAVCTLKGKADAVGTAIAEYHRVSGTPVTMLGDLHTKRIPQVSPTLAAADILVSLDRYDLMRAAAVMKQLKDRNAMPDSAILEPNLLRFFELQRMADGQIGYFDVELADDPEAMTPIIASTRQLISQLVS